MRVYNTAIRKKQSFTPIDPKNIRLYVCGPTVYDRAHLGNARSAVTFDLLFRLLRYTYGKAHVCYVRNITDIDDKINARAAQTGQSISAITAKTTAWFHEDMAALNVLRPTYEPRATAYIGEMIATIARLIERGNAYEAEGHVLFSVNSFDGYGALSGRMLEDMLAGARVEIAPFKHYAMDFVLWKPSTPPNEPGWDSPWGYGRPGWHIECSAMSKALLGGTFDIHGGGNDLLFPHHENERAQSLCAHAQDKFAQIWMHNEMLMVDGKKMSKSLGNFLTVRDLLDSAISGDVMRLVLLSAHYRKPLDWTEERLAEAKAALEKWAMIAGDGGLDTDVAADADTQNVDIDSVFIDALLDDLNTPQAIARLHALAASKDAFALRQAMRFLGLSPDAAPAIATAPDFSDFEAHLSALRAAARRSGDFSRLDKLKEALLDAGIKVNMGKDAIRLMPDTAFSDAKYMKLKSKLKSRELGKGTDE